MSPPASSLSRWLGRGAAALMSAAQTRLELATIELEEERLHIGGQLLLAAIALFFVGIGLLMASLLLVVVFWDDHRIAVLAALTLFYLGGGLALFGRWHARARAKAPLLAHTLAELRKDAVALRGEESAP